MLTYEYYNHHYRTRSSSYLYKQIPIEELVVHIQNNSVTAILQSVILLSVMIVIQDAILRTDSDAMQKEDSATCTIRILECCIDWSISGSQSCEHEVRIQCLAQTVSAMSVGNATVMKCSLKKISSSKLITLPFSCISMKLTFGIRGNMRFLPMAAARKCT
jgi:hypothetical protein